MQTALLLDAVSFYAIAWILFTAGPLPHAEPEPGRMREQVRAGLAYIRDKVVLRRLLVAQGAAFVFFSAVDPDRGRSTPRRRSAPATPATA